MSGQKITLSGMSFTDATLPVLRDDPLLSAGSLFLFDPGHSLGSFAGVPAASTTVPNVAWKEAAALIGSGTQASLAGQVLSANVGSTFFVVERSLKGGLHGMISHVNQVSANTNFIIQLPSAIRDYIYNNINHNFYFSLWSKLTRAPIASTSEQSPFHFADTTSNYLFHMQSGGGEQAPTANGSHLSPAGKDSALAPPVDRYAALATVAKTGTGPSATRVIEITLGTSGAWAGTNVNKAASRIIYRAYVEDLTVSGRTYAQADAINYALWQAAFGVGGKFYGDTFSDPATVVP